MVLVVGCRRAAPPWSTALAFVFVLSGGGQAVASEPSAFRPGPQGIRPAVAHDPLAGESPVMPGHVDQKEVESGTLPFRDLVRAGELLFREEMNVLDGFGRPAATGNGTPTKRAKGASPFMTRASAPETNSCAGCHNKPDVGGAGDFVANVFVLAQVGDVTESVGAEAGNERNTLGMYGAGAIELLAREMTEELVAIRQAAVAKATAAGARVTVALEAKGVSFGSITVRPNGFVETEGVEGVDGDLVVKPFHQKGVVSSLRVFTNNAYNHHHGLQSVERFGKSRTGEDDFDEDGVPDELSVGDVTAATVFQAQLPIPGRVLPEDPVKLASVNRGEALFVSLGCDSCHRPALALRSAVFTEPGPYNPPGNLRAQDVSSPYAFDLTKDSPSPHLERSASGGYVVRAYTDLKRHVICDENDPFYCNERLVQSNVPTDTFLTRKLWDVGNTGPWGHRGDLTTIGEAIAHHSGEARAQRERYLGLPAESRSDLISFLKTLQILEEGSPRVVHEPELRAFKKRRDDR